MSEKIKAIAKDAELDWHSHWNDDESNRLEKFAQLVIEEACRALNPMLRDQISRGHGVDLIKKHFGEEK